jgi:hypothetical protein
MWNIQDDRNIRKPNLTVFLTLKMRLLLLEQVLELLWSNDTPSYKKQTYDSLILDLVGTWSFGNFSINAAFK